MYSLLDCSNFERMPVKMVPEFSPAIRLWALCLIFFLLQALSFAQVDWQRYESPVLEPGQAGEWDEAAIFAADVIIFKDNYHMWYSGFNSANEFAIGHATSQDGFVWQKDTLNPVLTGDSVGAWDYYGTSIANVFILNDTLHLFYSGHSIPDGYPYTKHIGHAISVDGSAWIKDTLNPVISTGSNGSWDDAYVQAPCIVAVNGLFHCWYDAWDGIYDDKLLGIGHATSTSLYGNNWIKDQANPVLIPFGRSSGSWEDREARGPRVFYNGSVFHMWYMGGFLPKFQIGYAWSADGISWEKYPGNPVLTLGEAGEWDVNEIGNSSVILDEGVFKLWYTGMDPNGVSRIGYAMASLNDILVSRFTKIPDGDTLKAGETVSFMDSSSGIITSWLWDFGDDSTSTERNPQHVYLKGGAYNVTLTVTGPYGTDISSFISVIVGIKDQDHITKEFALKQNYPNPFNPVTMIRYQLAATSDVELSVYNLIGQKMATLVNKKQTSGKYSVNWDATGFASGVYIYTLETSTGYKQSRKLVLLK